MAADVSLPVWLLCDPLPCDARCRRSRYGILRRRGRAWSRRRRACHQGSGPGPVSSSSSRDFISEPSCSWPRSFMSGAILSIPRSRRWTWACSVFTKPQSRLSRSSASCVPSGATAPARMWIASSIPASASSSFQVSRLSNSSEPGVAPNRGGLFASHCGL